MKKMEGEESMCKRCEGCKDEMSIIEYYEHVYDGIWLCGKCSEKPYIKGKRPKPPRKKYKVSNASKQG